MTLGPEAGVKRTNLEKAAGIVTRTEHILAEMSRQAGMTDEGRRELMMNGRVTGKEVLVNITGVSYISTRWWL